MTALPIPLPPRTPSPPSDDEVPGLSNNIPSPRFPPPSPGPRIGSPSRNSLDPSSLLHAQGRLQVGSDGGENDRGPFNFKPTPYLVGRPPASAIKPVIRTPSEWP